MGMAAAALSVAVVAVVAVVEAAENKEMVVVALGIVEEANSISQKARHSIEVDQMSQSIHMNYVLVEALLAELQEAAHPFAP